MPTNKLKPVKAWAVVYGDDNEIEDAARFDNTPTDAIAVYRSKRDVPYYLDYGYKVILVLITPIPKKAVKGKNE